MPRPVSACTLAALAVHGAIVVQLCCPIPSAIASYPVTCSIFVCTPSSCIDVAAPPPPARDGSIRAVEPDDEIEHRRATQKTGGRERSAHPPPLSGTRVLRHAIRIRSAVEFTPQTSNVISCSSAPLLVAKTARSLSSQADKRAIDLSEIATLNGFWFRYLAVLCRHTRR